MVTFSPGRLPAGPNKGKTQTAAQASEVFRLCKHQAQAAGGSRAPRTERGQRARSKLNTELPWVSCTAGTGSGAPRGPGQVHCKRLGRRLQAGAWGS